MLYLDGTTDASQRERAVVNAVMIMLNFMIFVLPPVSVLAQHFPKVTEKVHDWLDKRNDRRAAASRYDTSRPRMLACGNPPDPIRGCRPEETAVADPSDPSPRLDAKIPEGECCLGGTALLCSG